jgi:hypothetical protein
MDLIYTMNIPKEMYATMGYDVAFGRATAALAGNLLQARWQWLTTPHNKL